MVKMRALIAVTLMSGLVAACGNEGDVKGGGDWPFGPDQFRNPDLAQPTGTPPVGAGPIWLENIASDDGTAKTSAGECLGFTIVTDEYTFAPDAEVTLGGFGVVPSVYLDSNHLRVGDSATGYECFWTKPLTAPIGVHDITIVTGSETYTVGDAFEVTPLKAFEVGIVEDTRIWSIGHIDEVGANGFERPYDVDIYRANFPAINGSHIFDHMELFSTGTVDLVPVMEFWDPEYTSSYLNRGGLGLIFPLNGVNLVVVKDVLGQGGSDATYDLSFLRKQVAQKTPSDNCWNAPEIVPNRGYYANYDTLTNTFDPEGNSGCKDTVYNSAIHAPGNDGVWKVKVPPGQTLRVSTYDNYIDNVTYLLPITAMTTDTAGCPTRPTNCVAAAGRYGGGNTDTMVYKNLSAADEEFFLIHDSATVMTSNVGSFMMNVEVFNR